MAKKAKKEVIAVAIVSDEHINSTVALAPPSIELDEGGTFRASREQCALFDAWKSFWNEFGGIKATKKIAIFNGDLGEYGQQRKNDQVVTRNPATVMRMVHKVLEVPFDVVDSAYIIRGSPFHTGKLSWLEEAIACDIDLVVPYKMSDHPDPATGKRDISIASWWHLRRVAGGVNFDITHHGSTGGLPWTEKHGALRLVERALFRYHVNMKQTPPDVLVRSHRHIYSDSGGNFDTLGVITPCWSLITEFAYRIGKENATATIGGVWFICEGGDYIYNKLFYKPEAKPLWKNAVM